MSGFMKEILIILVFLWASIFLCIWMEHEQVLSLQWAWAIGYLAAFFGVIVATLATAR